MSDKKEKLGLCMLIALVTGNMVGSGAFLLPSDMARIGSISIISLSFTVIGSLSIALVFSKMSLLISKPGGPYVYAREAFGEYLGFQTSYYYWLAVWIGNAAIVVATIGYLDVFFAVVDSFVNTTIAVLLIVWLLTLVNICGLRLVGIFQIVFTVLKFTPLLTIGVFGWWYFNPEYLVTSLNVTKQSNFFAFTTAMILTMWLFVGVESATIPISSVQNPQRNIPLATIIGTSIAAVIYILSNTAIFGMLPNSVLANSISPFATATEIIFGYWGKLFVALGAIIACLGSLNGWILLAAQVARAAANDGLFPNIFARCDKAGTPVFGLIITSVCISTIVLASRYLHLIEQFNFLVLSATMASVIAYFYTAVAEIIIIQKKVLSSNDVFHICSAIIASMYSLFLIICADKNVIFSFAMFVFFTIPMYALFCWRAQK